MTPIHASKKVNEKGIYSSHHDPRVKQKPEFHLRDLVRTADMKKVLTKVESTIYSYKIHTITEVIHDTIPSYRIDYLPERFNQNLIIPTKLSPEENNQVMKKLKLFQQFTKYN